MKGKKTSGEAAVARKPAKDIHMKPLKADNDKTTGGVARLMVYIYVPTEMTEDIYIPRHYLPRIEPLMSPSYDDGDGRGARYHNLSHGAVCAWASL